MKSPSIIRDQTKQSKCAAQGQAAAPQSRLDLPITPEETGEAIDSKTSNQAVEQMAVKETYEESITIAKVVKELTQLGEELQ
jgi:hypothetical protein